MKSHVKPFTLFLCMSVILFLFIGTYFLFIEKKKINDPDLIIKEPPTWKGIITLWDVSYVKTGTGNRSRWLNKWIKDFEKQNPGVFIDMHRMTPERVETYFASDINEEFLPDIVSLNNYKQTVPIDMLENLISFFSKEELGRLNLSAYQRIENKGKIIGVPWMMGGYILVLNQDIAEEQGIIVDEIPFNYDELGKLIEKLSYKNEEGKDKETIYGFCSYNTKYSRPLASMNYYEDGKIQNSSFFQYFSDWGVKEGIVPENIWGLGKEEAYNLFLNGKCGIILGTTDIIYKVRAVQEQGKGFRIKTGNIPLEGRKSLLQDQVSAFGILKQDDINKLKYCVEFLKLLMTKEVQTELAQLGMFPVVNDVEKVYSDDFDMSQLEKNIFIYSWGPDDKAWSNIFNETQEMN